MSADLSGRGIAPVARISTGFLAANAAEWADTDAIADLRADACGHGAAVCAAVLGALDIRHAVVDATDRDSVVATGMQVVDTDPDVVPEALFGLTGVGTAVMRFAGTVLGVKALRAGEGVSYGYRHRATRDTRIALVSGGYAQGVVRSLGGAVAVAIEGRRHPIVGRVAMDVCVVDIGDAEVDRGDEAVFFGARQAGEPVVDEWAQATGLHATELVAAVGLRARRVVR